MPNTNTPVDIPATLQQCSLDIHAAIEMLRDGSQKPAIEYLLDVESKLDTILSPAIPSEEVEGDRETFEKYIVKEYSFNKKEESDLYAGKYDGELQYILNDLRKAYEAGDARPLPPVQESGELVQSVSYEKKGELQKALSWKFTEADRQEIERLDNDEYAELAFKFLTPFLRTTPPAQALPVGEDDIERIAKYAAKKEGFTWDKNMAHICMYRETFHRVIGHALSQSTTKEEK